MPVWTIVWTANNTCISWRTKSLARWRQFASESLPILMRMLTFSAWHCLTDQPAVKCWSSQSRISSQNMSLYTHINKAIVDIRLCGAAPVGKFLYTSQCLHNATLHCHPLFSQFEYAPVYHTSSMPGHYVQTALSTKRWYDAVVLR